MEGRIINRPRISKWIGSAYIITALFIAIIFAAIFFLTDMTSVGIYAQALFSAIMIFVFSLMSITAASFYMTRYTIKGGVLYSWSPFAVIKVKISDIRKVERTRIPLHFRVGASLYSGMFYIPNFGWTKSIITNLGDALLITTRNKKRYMITPSNPDRFLKLLKK